MKKIPVILLALFFMGAANGYADTKVAMVGPFSGPVASWGEKAKVGAQLAVEDINAKGGVLGQKLELIIIDDSCDPKQAVSAANKILSQKIAFVDGHMCSGATVAAADVYSEEGMLMMTPTASNPALTDKGRWNIFRLWGRDDVQGRVLGNLVAQNFKGRRIAIVHDKQTYPQGLANEIKKNLNAANIKEVLFDTINPGEKDYSALVSKLKQADIDILVYTGFPAEAGLILRQIREQKAPIRVIGGDAFFGDELWSIAGDAATGTLFSFMADPSGNAGNENLVRRMKNKKAGADIVAFHAYAVMQVWADAAQKAGSLDAKKVADILRSAEFDTALGKVAFDKKGDLRKEVPFALYEWNSKGKFVPYKPAK